MALSVGIILPIVPLYLLLYIPNRQIRDFKRQMSTFGGTQVAETESRYNIGMANDTIRNTIQDKSLHFINKLALNYP